MITFIRNTIVKYWEILKFRRHLKHLEACAPARKWAKWKTARQAWEQCPHGDWLSWWAVREGCDHRQLVLADAKIVKLAVYLFDNPNWLATLDVAERYGIGQASSIELERAYRDACSSPCMLYGIQPYSTRQVYCHIDAAIQNMCRPRLENDTTHIHNVSCNIACALELYGHNKEDIRRKYADIIRECITPIWI